MEIRIIILIISLWFVLAIIFPFILFPNYLIKPKISYSPKIKGIVFKLRSKNKNQTLKNIYSYIVDNYCNKRWYRIFFLHKMFFWNTNKLLSRKQFLWCHSQNKILIDLLINSGQFKREDIKIKWVLSRNLTIHQYLIVNSRIKIDSFYRMFETLN